VRDNLEGVLSEAPPAYAQATRQQRDATESPAKPTGWSITIAPPGEPAQRLGIVGRVLGPDKKPIDGAEVYAYHADSSGTCGPGGNAAPRLAGRLKADAHGRYEIRTIRPGMYGGPPHVHFTVSAPRWSPESFTVSLRGPTPARGLPSREELLSLNRIFKDGGMIRDSTGMLRLSHDLVLGR
jgi:protocatechuate 3,4-dioxygenase beta subunit